MSIAHLIDTLTEWAQDNICAQVKLKVPPQNDEAVDADYDYELATPAAFPMYVPSSDKLPPGIRSLFPSLCVRFVTGQDAQATGSGSLDVQFCFSTWDPGLHGEDILRRNSDGTYRRWTGEEAAQYFRRTGGGWRDAWNFVDTALRCLESTTNIGGFVIDRATPIKYGPLTEQEAIADLYPLWFAWVSFRVNYPLVRNNEELQDLL